MARGVVFSAASIYSSALSGDQLLGGEAGIIDLPECFWYSVEYGWWAWREDWGSLSLT